MGGTQTTQRKRPLETIHGRPDAEWFRSQLGSIGWSQARYAGYIGVHKPAVTLIFQGARRLHLDEAIKTAKLFGVTLEEVFRRAAMDVPTDSQSEQTVPVRGWIDAAGRVRLGVPPHGPGKASRLAGEDGAAPLRLDMDERAYGPLAGGLAYARLDKSGRASDSVPPDITGRLAVVEIREREGLWLREVRRGISAGRFNLYLLRGGLQEEDAALVGAVPVLGLRF